MTFIASTIIEWGWCGFGASRQQLRIGFASVTWMAGSVAEQVVYWNKALSESARELAEIVDRVKRAVSGRDAGGKS